MSCKRAQASIRLNFPDQKQLTTLFAALTPETHATATRRANVNLQKDENSLLLTVEAEDTVALRATLNAYLHWINSTLCVIDAVEKG